MLLNFCEPFMQHTFSVHTAVEECDVEEKLARQR